MQFLNNFSDSGKYFYGNPKILHLELLFQILYDMNGIGVCGRSIEKFHKEKHFFFL